MFFTLTLYLSLVLFLTGTLLRVHKWLTLEIGENGTGVLRTPD